MSGTTPGRRVYLPTGREFPNWTVTTHVADGAMSSVYRARYTGLRVNENPTEAALKITSLLPADRERVVEEYETARRFSGHPQVVQVYDVFETDTTEYGRCVVLVHELGEESLKDYLDKSGALTRLELQRLAHHMANGIAALHEAKIIHSDIKPANILSFQSGWKIADLGAAAVINSHATNSSITSADYYAGTLAYATPEHAMALHEGRVPPPVHRNADTWAFGVVLHEAATGTHPFPSTAALIAGTPTIDPSLSPELADLVQACLSPPEFRPRDGAALLTLLEQPPTAAAVPAAVPTPAVAGADGALDTPAPVPADTVTAAVPVGAAADEAAQAPPPAEINPSTDIVAAEPWGPRRYMLLAASIAAVLLVGAAIWTRQRDIGAEDPETVSTATSADDAGTEPATPSSEEPSPSVTAAADGATDSDRVEDADPSSDTTPAIRGALTSGTVTLTGVVPTLEDERSLVGLMESVVGRGNVESNVEIRPGAPQPVDLSLDIADDIQFAVGSANIAPEFLPTLDQIVTLMKLDPNLTAVVKGHTDNTGDKVENLALSQRRAEAVVSYVASQGINRFRLEPQGRGSTEPIAEEATSEGRRQNRRIEFALQGLRLTP